MENLVFALPTQLIRINKDDIVCIKADGNYSNIYMFNKDTMMITMQLHTFEEKMKSDSKFVRVGRSMLVNKDYICRIDLTEKKMTLSGHKMSGAMTIEASRDALKALKEELEKQESKK